MYLVMDLGEHCNVPDGYWDNWQSTIPLATGLAAHHHLGEIVELRVGGQMCMLCGVEGVNKKTLPDVNKKWDHAAYRQAAEDMRSQDLYDLW